jgi:hypothetical protein
MPDGEGTYGDQVGRPKKRTSFKLRSGNTTPFKLMGSSPAKSWLKDTAKKAGKKVGDFAKSDAGKGAMGAMLAGGGVGGMLLSGLAGKLLGKKKKPEDKTEEKSDNPTDMTKVADNLKEKSPAEKSIDPKKARQTKKDVKNDARVFKGMGMAVKEERQKPGQWKAAQKKKLIKEMKLEAKEASIKK